MRYVACLLFVTLLARLELPLSTPAQAQPSVWTYHYDSARTGANTNETVLTPSNVNTNSFGKLFNYSVDAFVYAQPLYIPNVSLTNKGVHNVVYLATEGDTVYAFDADSNSGSNSTPLWSTNLLAAGEATVTPNNVGTFDIQPQIGISGTPVIDTNTGTLYVVAKSKLVSGGTTNYIQRLHALNIANGKEAPNSPVLIQASVAGTGEGSAGGVLNFDPFRQHNRSALLLLSNIVYLSFASHGDNRPYHGWVLGYNKTTLAQVSVFNTAPNGFMAGIWQGGNGPAADTNGNFFMMTGNGKYDGATNNDYGDSFTKLTTTNASTNLILSDWFTPYNQYGLGGDGANDGDLGSGGPMVLPDAVGSATHKHLLVGAGKRGVTIYLIDRDNMGHEATSFEAGGPGDTNIVQYITNALAVPGMTTPVYWNFRLYYLSHVDKVKAFSISNAVLSALPVDKSLTSPNSWFGNTMSLSANGNTNGLLWAIDNGHGSNNTVVLHVYNATNLSTELYNSSMAGTRDTGPLAVKFAVTTVANSKVYVGGESNVAVYGILTSNSPPTVTIQPQSQTVAVGSRVMLTVGGQSSNGFTTRWYFDGTIIPSATTTNYTITNVQLTNAGYYSVTLSNASGVTSSSLAYLSVIGPLTNSPGSVLAPTGLVNWWPADGNGLDIFGPNNATPQNNMTYGPGESGLAFQFDGVSAYLNVGAANLLPPWTASMWVNRFDGLTNSTILMGDGVYYLKLEQNPNTHKVGITQLGYLDSIFSSNYIVPTNTWTHLAFVASPTSVALYANGVAQGTITTNNFPLPRSYIGAGFASPRFIDFVRGSLDEILVFNRALSASEISGIYSAGSAGLVRAPQFTGVIQQTNGQITLSMEGQTGKTFTLLTSSNLVTWTTLVTVSNAVGTNIFIEAIATNGAAKFYRLSQP